MLQPPKTEDTTALSVRLEPEMVERLDAAASLIGWSRVQVIRRACQVWLDALEEVGPHQDDVFDRVAVALLGESIRKTQNPDEDKAFLKALQAARRRIRAEKKGGKAKAGGTSRASTA